MTDGLPKVAVLTTVDAAVPPAEVVRAASGTAQVCFLVDRQEAERVPMLRRVAETIAPTETVDYRDLGSCLNAMRRQGVSTVLTFSDACCDLVDRLRARLAGAEEERTNRWRKDVQRQRLLAAGLSSARQYALRGRGDLDQAAAELGFPLVVKPIIGVASRNVWLVRDPTEVERMPYELCEAGQAWRDLVVERFITGTPPAGAPYLADYASVELLVGPQGDAAFMTDRPPLAYPCRETGIVGPSAIDRDVQDHLIRVARAAHQALGLGVGAFHVEVKISRSEAEVIEVNGRLGGYVRRLVTLGTGVDVGRTALHCHCGIDPVLDLAWHRHVMGLLFQPPPTATRIVAAPSRAQVAQLAGVVAVDHLAANGSPVSWRVGSGGAAAKLWIEAHDAVALRNRTAAVSRTLDELFAFHDDAGVRVRTGEWLDRLAP